MSIPPELPDELWVMVVRHVIRIPGALSVELADPFSGPGGEVDDSVSRDRRALFLVSRVLRAVTLEVWMEYPIIQNGKELESVAKLLERSFAADPSSHLGLRTRRIDFVIKGSYHPSHYARILRLTPALLILVNKNNCQTGFVASIPPDILQAILEHGAGIQRLEFRSVCESLSLSDLVEISRCLPVLKTLRLSSVNSYPSYPRSNRRRHQDAQFKSLETLALDRILPQADGTVPLEYFPDWDLLLSYLSFKPTQLPALRRLDVVPFPCLPATFLEVHGKKIRMLWTTSGSIPLQFMSAMAVCGGVDSLVLTHSSDTVYFTNRECESIRRICIDPPVKETEHLPPSVMVSAVLNPLEDLLQALWELSLPELCEIRIRDVGLYAGVAQHALVQQWGRYYMTRGVRVVDRMGTLVSDPVSVFAFRGESRYSPSSFRFRSRRYAFKSQFFIRNWC